MNHYKEMQKHFEALAQKAKAEGVIIITAKQKKGNRNGSL